MRITKKWLREVRGAMTHRIYKLCDMLASGEISAEFERLHPHFPNPPASDAEKLKWLLDDMLLMTLPGHILD